MPKLIRCIEGHVFEIGKGQCPTCGWSVPPARRLNERLVASIPTGAQIRRAVLEPIARVSDHGAAHVPADTEKSPKFPELGPRLIRSRTLWLLALTVGLIALTAAPPMGDDPTILYAFCVFICVVFIFGMKIVMRSAVPVALLIYGALAEIILLDIPLWSSDGHPARPVFVYWYRFWHGTFSSAPWIAADSPSAIGRFLFFSIGAGLNEDTFKVLPVAFLLLLFWAMKAAPASIVSQPVKSRVVSWSTLDRATTVIAIAFASAAAFVLDETLGINYGNAIEPSTALSYIHTTIERNVNETNALLETIFKLFPAGDQVQLGPIQMTKLGWENFAHLVALERGYWKGLAGMIPRTLGLLTGHGAYAGIPAYYLALARGRHPTTAIFLVVCGFFVSALLHGAWDTLDGELWYGPVAVLSGVILWAVCVQAVALDRRSGFVDEPLPLGESIAIGRKIPDFPPGHIGEAAVAPMQAAQAQVTPAQVEPEAIATLSPLPAAPLVGTLIIEGTASSPGRRLHLRRGGGTLELAPDVALEVTVHHADPKKFGLKNVGSRTWKLTMPDGRKADIATGKNATLADNATIDFGVLIGRIEAAQA